MTREISDSDPVQPAQPGDLGQEADHERNAFRRDHLELNEAMAEAGVHVAGEGLADPSLARFVSVRDGETIVSDGPFAEVKEHLAGFYLIDVPSIEEAIA